MKNDSLFDLFNEYSMNKFSVKNCLGGQSFITRMPVDQQTGMTPQGNHDNQITVFTMSDGSF